MNQITDKYNKWIISILMFTSLLACNKGTTEIEETQNDDLESKIILTEEQYNRAGIVLDKVKKRQMGADLMVNGKIDVPPGSNVSISMPYGGFVKYIDLLPGSTIKKGQLLAVMVNPEFIQFQQDYLESWSNREYLKAEFERQEKLYSEKVASFKNFQQAKSDYLSNEARLKAMEARLKLIGINLENVRNVNITSQTNIYSPVSGSVREVLVNTGKYVNPQDVMMNITNSEDLHVELTVYESDIPKVRKGQLIRFKSNEEKDWREAEVFLVGSNVREDRSVTVHGHLKHSEINENKDLLPGMYITANIVTDDQIVEAVPEEAIVRFDGNHFVFIYKGVTTENEAKTHVFEMVKVTLGLKEQGFIQIRGGIDSTMMKENIVTKGAFTLLAKTKNTEEED